ncbi:MAG: cupin domain-containing protein [Oscillospiraceae bacterium]|nr:cupin domain-containing protein [Oscillospiraceae bacterium]
MQIILLSGGSGKRLWPLSNEIRSKQFIKIFRKEDGSFESMVQRVFRQLKSVDPEANLTIATSKTQLSSIHNQLGDDVGVSIEPCRRDTFPAIAIASAYLRDIRHVDGKEAVVVCPVDPYVEGSYFETLKEISAQVDKGEANLVLMGIEPTYPSDKYGYIIPKKAGEIGIVDRFVEKPDRQAAKNYIENGALWNGGVFGYRLDYLLAKAEELLGGSSYRYLYDNYETLRKISFDYAVVEKEPIIQYVRYEGEWKDIGTWNTLTEAMTEQVIGNGILDETCENVHILNELDLPILAMGLKDVVISASPDGILVSDKVQSGYIKQYVDQLSQEVKYAEKSWGEYRVLEVDQNSLTAQIVIKAGASMSYHCHQHRDEVWTITAGTGSVLVDGMERKVFPGEVIAVNAGCRHTIRAETEMRLIEVQLGREISAYDKQKFELDE